jgi:hypothetical protein
VFDNVGVKLTRDTLDRTASQISAFTFLVTAEESDQTPTLTVTLSGFVSLDEGVRATLCVSLGARASLVDLPSGALIEQPSVDHEGQPQMDENKDNFAFERQLTTTLPRGAEDVLITLFLLVERTQKNKTALGQLQVDHLVLVLPSANNLEK